MSEQLQEVRKLDLDLCLVTSKLGEIETVNVSSSGVAQTSVHGSLALVTTVKAIAEDVIFETLDWADLAAGKNWLEIQHRHNPGDRRKPYYATRITNRSTEKIRIDRFGTYTRSGKTLVLHSITGGFFSCQQFQEWYELDKNSWIDPGQVVTDTNNHSNLGIYWAYFGTTASGKKFVAGSAWNGKPWWQLW